MEESPVRREVSPDRLACVQSAVVPMRLRRCISTISSESVNLESGSSGGATRCELGGLQTVFLYPVPQSLTSDTKQPRGRSYVRSRLLKGTSDDESLHLVERHTSVDGNVQQTIVILHACAVSSGY